MKIKNVVSNNILVEVKPREDKKLKNDKIYVPEEILKREDERVLHATDAGTVRDIGPDCFIHQLAKEPFCFIGDKVFFLPSAGYLFEEKDTGKMFRILRDKDILAVLEEGA